jgi:site-specific DNA recombinase
VTPLAAREHERPPTVQALARPKQPNGGQRPFGYQNDRVTIKPSEAKVLREVAERILGGQSTGSMVRWLNESGVPTVTGAQWSAVTLKGMLTNPRYVGDLARGDNHEVIGKGAWRPILDRATFEALQQELAARAGTAVGRPHTASLLGGIIRCGRCLTPMNARTSGGGRHPHFGYDCSVNKGGCGRVSRRRRVVDEYVEAQLLAHVGLEDLEADRKAAAADVARLQRVDKDLGWRLYEVRTLYSEDRMSAEDAFKILDQLNRQRQATRRDLGRAKTRLEDAERSAAAEERWATWDHRTEAGLDPRPHHRHPGPPRRQGQLRTRCRDPVPPGHPTARVNDD